MPNLIGLGLAGGLLGLVGEFIKTDEVEVGDGHGFVAVTDGDVWTLVDPTSQEAHDYLRVLIEEEKKKKKRRTGYVKKSQFDALDVSTVSIPANFAGLEAIDTPTQLTDQFFRIYEVVEDENYVTITARHVWYDNLQNYTTWKGTKNTEYTGAAVCRNILSNAISPVNSHVASDCTDTKKGSELDYERKNLVEAFLDPENGVCAKYGLSLIRDNWDFYCLKEVGYDRGYVIQNGKNLLGIERKESIENVATRVVPIGKNKKGDIVWLNNNGNKYVDSSHINDYSYPRVEIFDTGLQIGKEGVTASNINEKLLAAGEKRFSEDKVDIPEIEMTIEFLSLGDTEEYSQYRGLDKVYLYDIVTIKDTVRGYEYSAQVVGIEHDILTGMLNSITLGSIMNSDGVRKIASWQVPEVSGENIRLKTITSGSFEEGAIQGDDIAEGSVGWVKIDSASITQLTTEQLEALTANIHDLIAGSITADDIAAGTITAGEIAAGAITATKIAAGAVETEKLAAYAVTAEKLAAGAVTADKIAADAITAGKISADDLEAINAKLGTAEIARAVIGTADIDYAQIKDADIEQLIAQDAITLRYYIEKLQVLNAQIAYATVGELVVKASDGKYYRLDFDENGELTPTEVTLTVGEITAGVTSDGHASIIETDLDVADLSASTVKAINALIDKITASRIDVAELWARQAFIDKLMVTDISSNSYIQSTIGDWQSGSTITQEIDSLTTRISGLGYGTVYMQPDEPDHSNLLPGDIWIQTAANGSWNDVNSDYASWQLIYAGNSQASPPVLPVASWQVLGSIPVMFVYDGVRFVEMYDSMLPTTVETQIQQLSEAIALRATREELNIISDEVSTFSAELTLQSQEIQAAVSAVNAKAATYVMYEDPRTLYTVSLGDIWIQRDEDFGSWQEISDSYASWTGVSNVHDRWLDGLGDRSYIWNGAEWVLTADYAAELYQKTLIDQTTTSVTILAETTASINNELYSMRASLKVANDSITAEVQRATTAEGGKLDKTAQYQTVDAIIMTAEQFVTDNAYAKVSGITIVAAGVTVSGSQYVVIESGGYFQVKTGNFTIDTNSSTYVMWAGASTAASAKFWLKKDGTIYSTSGTIGGWSIGANALSAGSGTSHVELKNTGDYAFWAGAESAASAPFSVKKTGVLKSISGTIGGFTIGANKLYSGSGQNYIALDSNAEDDYAFWCGNSTAASAPFRIARDGTVTLTQLKVLDSSGTETTVSLRTAGLWKIGGSYKTVNTVSRSGNYVSQITLSDGSVLNFRRAEVDYLDLSGDPSASAVNLQVRVWFDSSYYQYGTLNVSSYRTKVYNAGAAYADGLYTHLGTRELGYMDHGEFNSVGTHDWYYK